jgi:hypothetical protein
MATFHVRRTNQTTKPPRFEWLKSAPSFNDVTDEVEGIEWTPKRSKAHNFKPEVAAEWSNLIDETSVSRFGDAPDEAALDVSALEREARKAARKALGKAGRSARGLIDPEDVPKQLQPFVSGLETK